MHIYSSHNADEATLYGFEIDGRKDFSFIRKWLEGYYIFGNFSWTKSEVTLTEEQQEEFTTNEKDL